MAALPRTELALEEIKRHLTSAPVSNPMIESFFAQYLSVSFYSEVEDHVKAIYKRRLSASNDARISFFVAKTMEKMIGRVKKSEIKDMAANFGDDCDAVFDGMIDERDSALYATVINNRHLAAHGSGSNVTIPDIEQAIGAAERILVSLERAIA